MAGQETSPTLEAILLFLPNTFLFLLSIFYLEVDL